MVSFLATRYTTSMTAAATSMMIDRIDIGFRFVSLVMYKFYARRIGDEPVLRNPVSI